MGEELVIRRKRTSLPISIWVSTLPNHLLSRWEEASFLRQSMDMEQHFSLISVLLAKKQI